MIGMEPPPKGINHSATGSSTGPSTGSSSRPSAGRFSKSSTAFSARSFISRTVFSLCRRRPESKGPLGLTTLYSPTPEDILVADVVFIHGLNGGSHSTWSRGNDPERFWPCRWLPQDGAFKDVRIHTFGYPTDASRESPIRIPDIARSLLAAIKDSPVMNNKGNQPPLIFVAHSMGALVVKKAYILGHRDPEFKLVVDRVCAIFFLATPHQGAAIAQTLSRLTAIIRVRLYVEDLFPHSPLIQEISEEFPQVCGNIQLFSFFESRFMTIGGIKKLVVEKSSAVLNLANERGTFLDADHRNVAMYSSPDDPSYVAVKNALATVISSHQESSQHQMQCAAQEDQDALDRFLGVSDGPEDDIMIQEAVKLPGSCEWLTSKADYQSWKESVHSSFLWIRGRPGAGKSVLSGHIIGDLRSQKLDCCCFFFQARDNIKSTANGCLRSMAWQMAMHHPAVRDRLKVLMSQGRHNPIDKNDSHSVWRKLFLSGILKVKLNRPQFWVIDAMDECKAAGDMLTFLQHIQEHWPLSVLVTSRDTMDTHQKGAAPEIDIRSYTISEQDNLQDISLLLKANLPCLPCPGSDRWPTPEKIASHILEKSEGCFLWASIVCSELRQVTSEGELIKVMESTPSDMDALYRDILAKMQTARFGKAAAKALIAWATYSFRPLNVAEIQTPIEKDINDKIDVQRTISKSCGSLVYVDQYGKVQLVHATAREFLTREETESEFILSKAEGHRRLALVCLKFLLHDCPRSPGRARRLGSGPDTSRLWPSPSPLQPPQSEDPFTDYASKFAFQHLSQVHPNDEEILVMLSDFLASNNLLQWIEFTASNGDLRTILHAGKTINSILNRRAQDSPHLGRARRQGKLALLEKWGDDLIHLVTNFSGWLKRSPKAIHHLIPAFCPPDSAIHERFTNPVRGLKVQGLSSRGWNDCLTTITYPEGSRLTAVAAGPDYFAVGMMSTAGPILVYNDTIFQQVHDLRHGEPVRRLVFAGNGRLLASGGARTVRIWSLADGFQLCSFKISSRCLDLWFVEEDAVLRVATTQNHLIEWDVESNTPTHQESVKWDADFPDRMRGREPTLAKLGLTTHLLAVLYKGEDIVFWDCIDNRIHDMYEKDTGSVRVFGRHKVAGPSIPVRAAAFGQSLHTNLFAATYLDGDLVVYDIEVGNAIASAERANTLVLAASQDGRTLAGADSLGNLTLFEFETLRPLYRVRFDTPSIPAALCFTSDSLRFIEIRWGQCRVWEPSVLLRTDVQDDDINGTASVSAGPQEIDHQTIAKTVPSICAMVCSHESSLVICGMEDGSVFAYDISGPEPERQLLFVQTAQCGTHSLYLDDRASILACGDRSGRFTARTVSRPNRSRQPKTWEAGPLLIEGRIGSRDFVVLRQVLVSSKHERLLVSTVTQSTLWPMPTQGDAVCICQTEFENNRTEGSHWVTRLGPKSDLLLLVDAPNRQFKVYDWETLALIRMISPSLSPDTVLHRAAPLLHRHYFTTYARTLPKPGFAKGTEPISAPRSEILLWDYQKLEGGSEITAPRNELAALPSVVEHVIGAFGSRLVLYTTDHWIASVELSAPGSPDPPDGGVIVGSFVRHFFLPNDWVGSMVVSNMIFGVGREGEVLLARRSELAVIKRGLEVTEDGGTVHLRRPMNNNLRPLSGGRIPYRHRASSSIS